MDEMRDTSGISRRRALKGIGAGAAAAWAAPVLTSVAHAQAAGTPAGGCSKDRCSSIQCFGGPTCGQDSGSFGVMDCLCVSDVEGNCFCASSNASCTGVVCTSSSECDGDARCIKVCCTETFQCVPPCGQPERRARGSAKSSASA